MVDLVFTLVFTLVSILVATLVSDQMNRIRLTAMSSMPRTKPRMDR